jgi:hypothetical protein
MGRKDRKRDVNDVLASSRKRHDVKDIIWPPPPTAKSVDEDEEYSSADDCEVGNHKDDKDNDDDDSSDDGFDQSPYNPMTSASGQAQSLQKSSKPHRPIHKRAKHKVDSTQRVWNDQVAAGYQQTITDETCKAFLAFCCASNKCGCSPETRARFPVMDNGECDIYIQASLDSPWHRRCCHKVWSKTSNNNADNDSDINNSEDEDDSHLIDWASPVASVAEMALMALGNTEAPSKDVPYTYDQVEGCYLRAKREESKLFNEFALVQGMCFYIGV